MTGVPLDSRQAGIARALLSREPTSVEQLAKSMQLSARIVRYNLPAVESYLAEHDLRLVKRRGVGIRVEGDASAQSAARAGLSAGARPTVIEVPDRRADVLLAVLRAAPEPVRSEALQQRLAVSGPTIRRDVREAEAWLERHRLHLRRLPGRGLSVRGSEVEVRAGLLALLLEQVPHERIGQRMATSEPSGAATMRGLDEYLVSLALAGVGDALEADLIGFDRGDPTMLTVAAGIAVGVERARSGHPARLSRGRLRSLLDHPVSDVARRIAATIGARLELALSEPEVGAMTESLLGLAELRAASPASSDEIGMRVEAAVREAAQRLHPALATDEQLRLSLTEHMRRLGVRLRYGLPVSNPLLAEVRRRYPDIYAVATDVVDRFGPVSGTRVPEEEIGFLTMYLAGAVERHRLRHKTRVTVVCPAGMATVWILVSRLMAEFPQVEIARVVSKSDFEQRPDDATDLLVSTVPLEGLNGELPVVLVGALLDPSDLRRLAVHLGPPTRG